MNAITSLVLIVSSVSAYQDDPEGTSYFIENAYTNKFLYVGEPNILSSGILVARNVYIYDLAHEIPTSAHSAMFQLVTNNAIGPYYNIINPKTNSVLFASELAVGTENNVLNKVLAWTDTDHNDTPEALWNIRHFDDSLYIFNVYYGSYLYTNDDVKSSALLDNDRRVAMLMPNDEGGRVEGTQWLILNSDALGDTIEDSKLRRAKMVTKNESKEGEAKGSVEVKQGVEGVKEDEQKVVSEEKRVVDKGNLADREVVTVRMDKDELVNREQREKETVAGEGVKEKEQGVVGIVEERGNGRENVLGRKVETDKECEGGKEIEGQAVTETVVKDRKEVSKEVEQREQQKLVGNVR